MSTRLITRGTNYNQRAKPTLRGDLRRAIPDATLALTLSGIVFAIQAARVRAGTDPALQEMPNMLRSGGVWPYSMSPVGSDLHSHNALWFTLWSLQAPIAGAFVTRLCIAAW